MCLIGKTQLLCIQCRGIGLISWRGGSLMGFFLVVAGNWGTFSSYEGDAPSKLVFVYCSQDTCLGMTDIAGS